MPTARIVTRSFLAGALFSAWAGSAFGDCRVQTEKTEKEGVIVQRVTVENELVKYVFYPQFGGIAGDAWYKPKNINVAGTDYDAEGRVKGFGGLLDDRDGPTPLDFKVLQDTPDLVSVEFSQKDSLFRRTVILRKGRSVLQIDNQFANPSQTASGDYAYKTRNFPWPDGEPSNTGTISLCIPTAKAVRVLLPKIANTYPELAPPSGFVTDIGAAWLSTSGSKHRVTVATAFPQDSVWAYYWWSYRDVAKGTHEWIYRRLPAGKLQRVTAYLILFDGLTEQVDVTRDYAAALERAIAGDQLTLKLTLLSLWEDLKGVTVKTQLCDFDGKALAELPAMALGDVALNGRAQGTVAWKGDLAGNLLIKQQVLAAGRELGRYEDALKDKPIPDAYKRKIDLPQPEPADIPGWKKEEKKVVEVTDQDKKAGAKVYMDEFAATPETWGKPLQRFEVDVAQDEWESFAVAFLPVDYEGEVAVAAGNLKGADGTAAPATSVSIRVERLADVSKPGKSDIWAHWLEPGSSFKAEKGKSKNVWFTLDTHGIKPGDYVAPVTLTYGPRKLGFDLKVKVWDVAYPIRPLMHLEVEHYFEDVLPGVRAKDDFDWKQVQAYLDDFRSHRVTVLQNLTLKFGLARKRADGTWELSAYDEAVNRILDAGMTRFMIHPLAHSQAAALSAYLRGRGCPPEELWVKLRDEQPADQFPAMVEEARDYIKAGWKVYSTFHNLIADGKETRIFSPFYRMFQGGISSRADYAKRLANADIDPSNELWRYSGWGACWFTYAESLGWGWECAAMGLDGFHLHVYYGWRVLDDLVLATADKPPVDSVSFEAARDTMEAGSLYRLAQYQVMKLEEQGQAPDAVARARKALAEVIGDGNAIINRKQSMEGLRAWEDVKPMTIAEHVQAKRKVFQVLADLKPHATKIAPDLYWGSSQLAANGKVYFAIAGEPQAKTRLEAAIRDAFGIDCSKTDNPNIQIYLGLDKSLGAGRYSFDGNNPWNWRLLAGDEAGMERGIKNLVAFMTPYSIRRLITRGLPGPQF